MMCSMRSELVTIRWAARSRFSGSSPERTSSSAEVWMADPGRAYLPKQGMAPFANYVVPTTRELEDREERLVVLYRVLPAET